MKSIRFNGALTALGLAAALVSGCSDAQDPGNKDPRTPTVPDVSNSEYLPYYISFKLDGTPDIRIVGDNEKEARVVDVKDEEFPINAKIKRVQTLTFVTYEGSCEILTQTATGYKKIIIHNDAICAKIKP